ncbi:MAG: DUF5110 domain-containing protein, partial [Winogradskyella sp.]|uniref:DUF5110 domain-containing protein n=1 Tax=Winogradskyella sp. TaxID=1883156 RepID=UPI003859D229
TDYWTGKIYEGKKHYSVLCPLDELPIFVKEGAIIPMQDVVQYIGEKAIDNLKLEIYPNASNTFVIYNDDGRTLKYKNGNYNTANTKLEVNDTEVSFVIDPTVGDFKQNNRYTLNFHLSKKPLSVTVNNEDVSANTRFENNILSISPKQDNGKRIEIKIKK